MNLLSKDHLPAYLRLMRVDRPVGTYLVAWPALWSLWLAADGIPPLTLLAVFLVGAFLMRSAGCVINDYADRNIDQHVERTKNRPLALNEINAGEALTLFVILCALAACLLLFTNTKTAALAVLAAVITTLYPFMKRHTHLPQLVLGMAFSCAVPMAFAAVSDDVPCVAWLLYIAVVFWVISYDTFYAMVDRDDDLKIGVKSTAILFGRHDRTLIALFQILFVILMIAVGLITQRHIVYFIGLLLAGVLFIYQQTSTSQRSKEKCFGAFLNNNYVGMVIFIGIASDYALFNPLTVTK